MKPTSKLTLLAVLTASLLSACSSGGGKAPAPMPAPEVIPPKDEQPKQPAPEVVPPKDEQPKQPAPEVVPPKAEEPKQPAPEVIPPKAEEPKQPAPEVIPPKAEEPKQPAPEVIPPKAEEPKQPAPKPEPKPNPDQEVFNRLSLQTKDGVVLENLFKLVLREGTKKIELDVVPPHSFTGTPKIETLRDIDGTLVGYYGYARVSEQKEDKLRDEQYAADRHFFIQYADSHQLQQPAGLSDIRYQGKMFYQYKNYPNNAEEATVNALYSVANKTLGMTIVSDKDGAWTLHQGRERSSPALASVTEGRVAGHLMFSGNGKDTETRLMPDGVFVGGFYGKNGSVLTGKAHFDDKEKGWEGVVGATAVTPGAP